MEQEERSKTWVQSIEGFTRSRGFLPHLELPGSWYFVTSNTHNRQVLSEPERDIIMSAIQFHTTVKYELDAMVIMPDHFHAILHPIPKEVGAYFGLREILHSIKSFSAKEILKKRSLLRDRSARSDPSPGNRVWQEEYQDHIIRNDKDYLEKLNYILFNPVSAEIVEHPESYRWLWHKGM